MTTRLTRREMLRTSAATGVGFWLGTSARPARALPPSEKLDIAVIGLSGRGQANWKGVAGENIVALCDVDDKKGAKAFETFPDAKRFRDYRKMFDAMHAKIDGVVISTPDHTHFHPAYTALQLGKHCYLEKPMAHSVWECRRLTDTAREKGVATQLGVQRHTIKNVHRVVELVQSGAIGDVRECHSWVGGNRGMPAIPTEFPKCPPHLDWNLWLGPAKVVPYHEAYAHYNWRFWWDFGTGETGNWGCHILDIPFWALDLAHPRRVDGSGPPVHDRTTPKSMAVRYEFPARGDKPPVVLHWYHTKEGPPVLREHGLPHYGSGTLFVGSKGLLLTEFGKHKLFPESRFKDFERPPQTIPDSPGFYREWTTAAKGGEKATCHFDYSGPMAETVLLGNVAYRAGGGFDWDAQKLEAKGNSRAQELIRTPYRKGWELG